MFATLSGFGIFANRPKGYVGAVLMTLAAVGLCSASAQDGAQEQAKKRHDCKPFVYVVNDNSSDYSGYSINEASGVLEPLPGSPYPGGPFFLPDAGGARQIAVDTKGKFLFEVGTSGETFLSVYAIEPNGSLTGLPDEANGPPEDSIALALDPSDRYLYVVGGANIAGYQVDAATGGTTLIPGSTLTTPPVYQSLTVDPRGRFVYVVFGSAGSVQGYRIEPSTGALTLIPGSPFPTGVEPSGVTVDPTGRFLYVSNTNGGSRERGSINGYDIDPRTGALRAMRGSPFAIPEDGWAPDTPAIDPGGRYLYSPLAGSHNVAGYHIHPITGELTPVAGSPFASGTQPIAAAIDPTGRFVYITDQNDGGPGSVYGFSIEPISGSLRPLPDSPFPAGMSTSSIVITGHDLAR